MSIPRRAIWRALGALGALISLAACATSPPATPRAMELGPAALAPRGYLQFCARRPDQCGLQAPTGRGDTVALTAALNREEWGHVLSVRPEAPVAPPAPAAAPPPLGPIEVFEDAAPIGFGFGVAEFGAPPAPSAPPAEAIPAPAPALESLFQGVRRAPPVTLTSGDALIAHLDAVNRDVNARIRPADDIETFGQDDYWDLPLLSGRNQGNCKHYALEKRRLLVEGGMSEDALSLAIVRTRQGETHAVLIVATDRGELVLDNLTSAILNWWETGYTWLSRQTPGEPLRWASIAPHLNEYQK